MPRLWARADVWGAYAHVRDILSLVPWRHAGPIAQPGRGTYTASLAPRAALDFEIVARRHDTIESHRCRGYRA